MQFHLIDMYALWGGMMPLVSSSDEALSKPGILEGRPALEDVSRIRRRSLKNNARAGNNYN